MKLRNTSVHFVGIGGISMSALAMILKHRGCSVSGSDLVRNEQVAKLCECGIVVSIGHRRENIPPRCELVVYTGAIHDDNPELVGARERQIATITREELLAQIESGFGTRIAVAGTHGKSSTVAMIHAILDAAGLEPTVHNGAVMKDANSNLVLGGGELFVTEACEFKRSLLTLDPTIAVVTNVDADHMDCYKNIGEIKNTFGEFAHKADIVVKNADCEHSSDLEGKQRTITIGIKNSNSAVRASDIVEHTKGKYAFTLSAFGSQFRVMLNVLGFHNIYNALAAAAVALQLNIKPEIISAALGRFGGIARRFETIGNIKGTQLITDYAHHPAEIATTIATAKSLYGNKFLIVFQPHTYTRTVALFDDFVAELRQCDTVLYKTYAAREKPTVGGRAVDLHRALPNSRYFSAPHALQNYITRNAHKYDAIILTGAGDINETLAYE